MPDEEATLSTGQKIGLAAIATALVLASKGKISSERASSVVRFGAKGLFGIGAFHLTTAVSDHGPTGVQLPPDAILIETPQPTSPTAGIYVARLTSGQTVAVAADTAEEGRALVNAYIEANQETLRSAGTWKVEIPPMWFRDP